MTATLLLDSKKDTPVTLAALKRMSDPVSMGAHHRPYRYDEIVETLVKSVKDRGYDIIKKEMALSRGDKMILGVMQLRHEDADTDRSIGGLRSDIALGFRGSHSQLSSLRCAAGETVWLCSNLMMSADMFIVAKKFTTNLRIKDAIGDGLEKFGIQHKQLEGRIERMVTSKITTPEAKGIIFDSVTKNKLPLGIARSVAGWYFGEEYGGPEELTEDCAPRTEFGLHNSFTRSLHGYAAQPRFEHTKTVGQLFGM